ncbi:hypothetical protein CVT25_005855 [Psilocybe cyanescens]|uniref:MARVEL domain-containing protein n=1 Tax=Psilocybe cyanescens TaxID=93625 RepID=A0A409VLY9_PSICY|nr:hypothetical protein CVT25_005855 [Psilocybe cyanescens]
MTILSLLLSGLLAVILWFEISSTSDMTSAERVAFAIAALTESILFVASIFGLVGAIVKKQLFTQIYAYIIYVHFVLNFVVAIYLTYEVTRTTHNAETLACQAAIKDSQAQDQCTGLLTFATWVYAVIAVTIILVELYGAVIVTRYLNQLKREKKSARTLKMDTESAFQLKYRNKADHQYARLDDPAPHHELPPLQTYYLEPSDVEFNPYTESGIPSNYQSSHGAEVNDIMPPVEVGYGGDSWTHEQITFQEKEKLKRLNEPNLLPLPHQYLPNREKHQEVASYQ